MLQISILRASTEESTEELFLAPATRAPSFLQLLGHSVLLQIRARKRYACAFCGAEILKSNEIVRNLRIRCEINITNPATRKSVHFILLETGLENVTPVQSAERKS